VISHEAKANGLGEILPQHNPNRRQNRTKNLQGMFHVKHPLRVGQDASAASES
jgi:hypothetical protein